MRILPPGLVALFMCACPVAMGPTSSSSTSGTSSTSSGGASSAAVSSSSATSASTASGSSGTSASGSSGFAWEPAAPCPVARFEAMGAVVDDRAWVLGGFTSSSLDVTARVDVFDPATGAWTRGPDLPGAQTHPGVTVADGTVWLAGGMVGWPGTVTAAAFRLQGGQQGTWSALPDLPAPRAALVLSMVDGALHAVGGLAADGNTDSGAHAVLALTSGTPASAWTTALDLPNPRNHLGGVAVGGALFVVGGRHVWNENNGHQVSVHRWNAGAWDERAGLPTGRSEIGGATLDDGAGGLIVIGGSVQGVQPTADVLRYRPDTNSWTTLPPLPGPRKGAVAVRIGQRIVVTTGSPTSIDPSGDTWVGCCL